MIARVSAGPVAPVVGAFITEVFGRSKARPDGSPARVPSTYGSTEADSISAGGKLLPFADAMVEDCPELSYYSTDSERGALGGGMCDSVAGARRAAAAWRAACKIAARV